MLLGLLAACGLLFFGSSTARAEPGVSPNPLALQIFTRVCSQCHGLDGKGVPGRVNAPTIPDFTSAAFQQSRSNPQLKISVLEGKDRLMPANRDLLNNDEGLARDLVAYVRTFAPQAPPPPTPVVSVPPKVTPTPTGTSSKLNIPEYALTGNFETDFDNLSKRFDVIQKQVQEIDSAPTTAKPSPPSAPPVVVPPTAPTPVTTPPTNPTPVTPPPSVPEKPQIAAVPVSDRPFTNEDVARGRELFLGHRRLAGGGAACITCHAANNGQAREGGRLGPDLTQAFERMGGRMAVSAHLWAPKTTTMRTTYERHPLDSDEAFALTAYLEDTAHHADAAALPLPLKFLWISVGGALLGLATLSILWRNYSRRPDRETPTTPTLVPLPVDCLGAGL